MPRPVSRYLGCIVVLLAVGAAGCREPRQFREFPVKGQVLSVASTPRPDGRRELSLKHEDIPGFMPAMTMAYAATPASALDGVAAGDLITARLVLDGNDIYLDRVTKTGHAPVPLDARPVKAMDVMETGDAVPDDELRDQTGATRKLSDWRGHALAVTFVYTRCPMPDFCPLMDRRFADLQKAIAAEAGLKAHLVSVSFDPSHDTPEVIAAHARVRGADPRTWSYLTGDAPAIEHFTSRFGVSAVPAREAPETIVHNLRTAIVDTHGRLVKVYSGSEWTVDALLADLRDAASR